VVGELNCVDGEMGGLVREGRKREGGGWGDGERGDGDGEGDGEGDGGWVCRGRYSILEKRNIFR